MKPLHVILIALIALLAPLALADLSTTADGTTTPYSVIAPDGSVVSTHQREDKAIERAANESAAHEGATYRVRKTSDLLVKLDPPKAEEPPVVVEPDPDPVDPPNPSPVDPEPTAISIFIDAEGGPTFGVDTNDGLTAGSAVATIERARIVAWHVINVDPAAVVSFRFRRGDTFPAFGEIKALDPGWIDQPNDWRHTRLRGSDDQPLVITGYGDGPRPIFDGTGNAFAWQREQSNIELRGIEVHGGRICHARGFGTNIKLIDCIGVGASVLIQADGNARIDGFEMRNCVIRDVMQTGSAHAQGMFINRVDNWSVTDCVFYRNGWMVSAEGEKGAFLDPMTGEWIKLSIYNHGIYVTGECSPATECDRNVFIYNSGSGIQLRPTGNCRDNFVAWNGQTGINWGATFGANSDDVPGTGEVTGNVVFNDTGLSGAITVGDIGSGRIAGNLLTAGSRGMALQVNSIHGENPAGGTWFGVNDLVIEDNTLIGDVELQGDGWGVIEGADGLTFKANRITGKFVYDDFENDANKQRFLFADPNGKVVIENEAEQVGQSVNVTPPVMDAATIDALLSGEKTAADMISEVMN